MEGIAAEKQYHHERLVLLRTRRQLIVQLQAAEQRARTDAVTGVYNRRFMEEALARETARAERSQGKLSVMLADIDGFKNFNTNFGHLTGDRVLAEVAALLQKNFRAADLVTRYGGDEFLVIMPDTDLPQAEIAVNRLGWWLEKWNRSEQREYRLGISCGVAAYKPKTTVEDVIKAGRCSPVCPESKADRPRTAGSFLSKTHLSSCAPHRVRFSR